MSHSIQPRPGSEIKRAQHFRRATERAEAWHALSVRFSFYLVSISVYELSNMI